MGGYLSRTNKECRSLWIGLDGTGKTTAFYQMKLGHVVTTIPTIAFGVEMLQFRNISFTVWDIKGNDNIRPLWKHYYQNTDIIIWFVDSSDRQRIDESAEELHKAVNGVSSDSYNAKDVMILIFANKNDLTDIMNIGEIANQLQINKLKQPWFIQSSNAVSGDGLNQGFEWIVSKLNNTNYKYDDKTVGIKWLCSEYTNWNQFTQNNRKSILLIYGWIRNMDKKHKLGISKNVTQSICQFYTDLDLEYKFKYYG